MSGIAVIYSLDGRPADSAGLDRMLEAIAYRGRDGIARRFDGPIAIGHAMLHTTPESTRERQPLCDESLCLSFDGRVDNREELAAALERAGAQLKTDTDAELVLRAYQCWGADSPRRILGDFAYALWDGPRRQLFCARDPLGMKPLYYFCDGRRFICGSEAHAILAHPGVPREPNEGLIAEYLGGLMLSRDETLFRGIMRLPGGEYLIARAGGVTRRVWFSIDFSKQIRYRTDDEYAEHLRHLITEAVRCRMRNVTGVAAELSGGVDSSSVVGVAQTLMRDGVVPGTRFEAFSMRFDHPDADERAYINDVVAKWGLAHAWVEPAEQTTASCVAQVRRFKDIPVYPNAEILHSLNRAVAGKGFRVCLTGQGGDLWQCATFAHYADLLRRLRFGEILRRLRAENALQQLDRYRPRASLKFLLRHAVWPLVPPGAQRLANAIARRKRYPDWLQPDFVRRTALRERIRRAPKPPTDASLVQQSYCGFMASAGLMSPLESLERWASWFGFDLRHPLLDLRIMEFTLATPQELRRRAVLDKYAFRLAMGQMLPGSVLNRPDKGDFTYISVPTFERLGGERLLDAMTLASRGWIDPDKARHAYREMAALYGAGNPTYAPYTWTIFQLFAIELWLNSVFSEPSRVAAFQEPSMPISAQA